MHVLFCPLHVYRSGSVVASGVPQQKFCLKDSAILSYCSITLAVVTERQFDMPSQNLLFDVVLYATALQNAFLLQENFSPVVDAEPLLQPALDALC